MGGHCRGACVRTVDAGNPVIIHCFSRERATIAKIPLHVRALVDPGTRNVCASCTDACDVYGGFGLVLLLEWTGRLGGNGLERRYVGVPRMERVYMLGWCFMG